MADWVVTHKPYVAVTRPIIQCAVVLRNVPFSNQPMGDAGFGLTDDEETEGGLLDFETSSLDRTETVDVTSGIVVSPDCDIYQHKINTVVIAQVLTLQQYVERNRKQSINKLEEAANKARETNPGEFNKGANLFFLPGDDSLEFSDSVVLFSRLASFPIVFAGEENGFEVEIESVAGQANVWFMVRHQSLRARLIAAMATCLLRIGLEDANP